jgi:hypothetical protein
VEVVPSSSGCFGVTRGLAVAGAPRSPSRVLGARASPEEIGSDASPICWLATLLAAIETAAAISIPRIASAIQRAVGGSLIARA